MMGQQDPPQRGLFYTHFNLDTRIRPDHPLRRIDEVVDFDFVSAHVEDLYGQVGRESIPPPTILRLMFLLFFYDVRSERELMSTLPERLDWLWFLRYDLDSSIPDHSVLSKARRRWGADAFAAFFRRIVDQCRTAGLLEGQKIYCDSSIIDANASIDSVVTAACQRLDEGDDDAPTPKGYSTTDPDAAIVTKRGAGPARPRYKSHRAVDGSGVVTATKITPGDVDEGRELDALIEQHEDNTGEAVRAVVADSQYGSAENLLACSDRGIEPHMAVRARMLNAPASSGLFDRDAFAYDPSTDSMRCPNGAILERRGQPDRIGSVSYVASVRDCSVCPLKAGCTRSSRRSVRRHVRQKELDQILRTAATEPVRADLRRRQWLVEGSFGQATRFGFKRARYRGLANVAIQDFLIATIQNVQLLCRRRPNLPRVFATLTQREVDAARACTKHFFKRLALAAARVADVLVLSTHRFELES